MDPVDGTHFGRRGISGTDLVGCVSSLDIPRASGAVPQVLTLLGGARFIAWRRRRSFLREHRRGPFWGMPGVFGQRPSAWTQLKKPCATLVQLVGRSTNTVMTIKIKNRHKSKRSNVEYRNVFIYFSFPDVMIILVLKSFFYEFV